MKQCGRCKEVKSAGEFGKDRSKHSGLSSYCLLCKRANNKERPSGRVRASNLKRYGLTVAEFDAMKAAQEERCAICRQDVVLCVDHCHTTGRIRGLLCHACNHGLGNFKDNPALLLAAVAYLEKE